MATKRVNGEGNIRKRDNGTWEARLTIDGKRRSFYGKTRREVSEKLAKVKAEIEFGVYVEDKRITLAGWVQRWLSSYCFAVKPSTRYKYEKDLQYHVLAYIGDIPLTKLKSDQIQQCYTRMRESGLTLKTINNVHSTLHKVLRKAVEVKLLLSNPSDVCSASRGKRPDIQTIPQNALHTFFDAAKDSPYFEVLYFLVFTGLRRSEVVGLTWDCIDFEKGYIKVYRQYISRTDLPGHPLQFMTLKNGKTRTFKVAESVIELLLSIKEKQDNLSASPDYSNEEGFVFASDNGTHLYSDTVYRAFKRIAASIDMPTLRLHDLRHTFATLSIQNGTDIKTVSTTLGHATAAYTLDIYTHVSEIMQNDAASRMDNLIQNL